MLIKNVHPLQMNLHDFINIQNTLRKKVTLKDNFNLDDITYIAGVDVAYWQENVGEWGICCIAVIHNHTGSIVEEASSIGRVKFSYMPGYLSLRELPLILQTARTLKITPDIFMFDGNGYLHPRHMGIATHASFFLDRPTIGVAKNFHHIQGAQLTMPGNHPGCYENITVDGDIYGRILRTRKNVKPIFISCGNHINLQSATTIILNHINDHSRLPVPVRRADLKTRQLIREHMSQTQQHN